MKSLAISFAWKRHNRRHVASLSVLALAALAAIASGWAYFQLHTEQERWQSDWRRLNGLATEQRNIGTPEEQERMKAELRFANQVIDRLDTPWDALFGAVEGAYSDQAILLSVEPDTERREVRLTAEAKDLASMLEYLKQVRQSPVLRDAHLSSHQINQQDALKPVRFTIEARWVDVPATLLDPVPGTSAVAAPPSTEKISMVAPEAKP